MRALREGYATSGPPNEIGPVEPLVVLASVGRPEPVFDPEQVFDRALFGMTAEEVGALGPRAPHLCEVAYEALEQAALRLDALPATRIGTWLGVSAPGSEGDAATVAHVLGLPGPAIVVTEPGASALLAVHVAAQSVRAGEVDLALVLGRLGEGVAAVVIGRADRADHAGRVRAVLLGSAVARVGAEPPAPALAALRGGVDLRQVRIASAPGLAGLCESVLSLESGGESIGIGVDEVGATVVVHVLLGPAEQTAMGEGPPKLLALSARSGTSLRALVRATADRIGSEGDLAGLANDALCRPSFEQRVAVPIGPAEEVRDRLLAWCDGDGWRAPSGRVTDDTARVAFVVPPAGAQFVDMADELYGEPVFRDALNRCDRALRTQLARPLLSVLYPARGRETPVDDPVFANPLTFALAFALSELLRSRGVVPAAVLGCGVGELAAAAIAGSLELEAAIRLAVDRGRLLRTVEDEGWRCVLFTHEARAAELVGGIKAVDVVAVPVPDRVVIGGESFAVAAVAARAEKAGIRVARIAGGAAHSPVVDPVLPEFRAAAADLVFTRTEVAVVSAALGRRLETADPDHWVATLRAPIRLAAGVHATHALGCSVFVELSPRPTVVQAGEHALAAVPDARWYPLLQPGVSDRRALEEVLAALWVRGVPVDRGEGGRMPGAVELPTYCWDRRPLDAELGEEAAVELPPKGPSWLPGLPELAVEPEVTLVPWDERASFDSSDDGLVDLVDLTKPPPRPPLERIAFVPDGDGPLSIDSEPRLLPPGPRGHEDGLDPQYDLTLEDLRVVRLPSLPPVPGPPPDPTAELLEAPVDTSDPTRVWAETWTEDSLPDSDPPVTGVTFVILADAGGMGDYLSTLLEQAGNQVLRVFAEAPHPRDDGTLFVADPLAPGAWRPLADGLGVLRGTTHILHLWSLDGDEERGPAAATGWPAIAGLAQEIAARGAAARIHIVTRGAVQRPEAAAAAVSGALWGLAGLIASELPALYGGIVDLDPDDEDVDALLRHLLYAVDTPGGAHAFRGGARLRRGLELRDPAPPAAVDTSCAWVLAGDIDAHALELGNWLAESGVKRIYLVCAVAPPPEVLSSVLELQRQGIGCVVVRGDLAQPRERDAVRQRLAKEPRISGVVVRSAAPRIAFRDLQVGDGLVRWRRGVESLELLLGLTRDAPVWAWCEGRSLDGAAGSGVAGPLGAALAARLSSRGKGPAGVFHTGPAASWVPGQAVRLLVQFASGGGVSGAWR